MPTYEQTDRPLRIKTPLGENVLLVQSLSGSERLGRPFQYELVLLGEAHNVEPKDILGQNVTIFVEKPGKEPRFFHGSISRFAQTKYERKMAEYHATMVPWLWFLTRSSDCRIFQNKTIPEILKQVFDDHGFSDVIDRLHGSYRQWDYCVQYRETAFDFVSRLMEEEGIYYYFKHEEEKHSLVLCDSPASHKQFAGYEELLYRPSSESVQETLWSWVVQHEVQSGAYKTTDFDFTTPRRNSLANSFVDRSYGHSQFEQFDYLGEQSPFNEGERYSKLRLEERQAQYEIYSGQGDARGISAGVRFVLKGHPRKDFEREYLTTGADYLVSQSLENTSGQGPQFEYKTALTAIPLDEQFRAPRQTPKPIVHGPQTAIVVGPSGEKIYTDQYGRVKVHFHWDRHGTSDENSSCWVRVSQGWAGKSSGRNFGDMAIPHVGDEVIVECLEGDPDRPIITGRVYNEANMPPLELPTYKDKRIWQDDFGNRLVFDATPGDEHIRLRSPHHNSGLTLGRSVSAFTESNAVNPTLGDVCNVAMGMNVGLTAGLALTGVLGANMAMTIGSNYSANLAAQCAFNLGPQYSYSHGAVFAKSNGNDNKAVEGTLLVSAKKALNLVASASTDKAVGTAVLHADKTHFEISVGPGIEPQDVTYKTGFLVAQGILACLPIASAALAAGATGYVDTYNADASDANAQEDIVQKQEALLGSAAALQGLGLIALIVCEALSAKGQTAAQLHQHTDYNAKLKLTQTSPVAAHNTGVAKLEATQMVELEMGEIHKPKDAIVKLDKDLITLQHIKGGIKITTTKGSIDIDKNGQIKISGMKVEIPGSVDTGNGALTVTAPLPPPPTILPQAPAPPAVPAAPSSSPPVLPPPPVPSDENIKKNIEPLDYIEVLDKLARVPVQKWHYQWEPDGDTPNIGPMAQAFKAAFYPGRDDKSISMLEFDGVQLAAIQGLNQKLTEELKRRDAENAELKARLEKLERMLSSKNGEAI